VLTRLSDLPAALPKAELHVHLDGSLRPTTLVELARERGVSLPAYDPRALKRRIRADNARSLEEYLERFVLTLSVMQDAAALERVAFEVVEDHARENVRYAEIRFCPALCTRDGLRTEAVLDAALRGMKRASEAYPIHVRVIVCALRTLDPAVSVEMAELAVAYADRGVVALDLAGAEAGYPVREHLEAFRVAHAAGLPVTVHAGEGFGAPSIREAVELAGASRIGHGTRLYEDAELLATLRERRIPLEVCLTSNVQTGVVPGYEAHPMRRYLDEGIRVALCTDNRLVSGVSLTEEYLHAVEDLTLSGDGIVGVARTAFEVAFVDAGLRSALLEAFDEEVARLGREEPWEPK
jgi:adenosine deaminase